jgi:hypothetical protein
MRGVGSTIPHPARSEAIEGGKLLRVSLARKLTE